MAAKSQNAKFATKKEVSANRYVTIAAVCVILALIITGLVAKYLGGMIITNTKVIQKKRTAVSDLKTKLENAPKLIEEYKGLQGKADIISHALPTTADFPQIVAIIDSLSAASGVQVKSVSPNAGSAGSGSGATSEPVPGATAGSVTAPQTTAYSIDTSGTYDNLIALLKNLEVSARPMRVDSIDFTGNTQSLTASIGLTTYYQDKSDISDKTEVVK